MADGYELWLGQWLVKIAGGHITVTCLACYIELTDQLVTVLCHLLSDREIKEVEMDCFHPDVFALKHFDQVATAIVANKSITRLTLVSPETLGNHDDAKQQMACAEAIVKILEQGSLIEFGLRTIHDHDVKEFGDVVWGMFAGAIEHNPRLKKLTFTLKGDGVGHYSSGALTRILFNNTQIEELSLEGCHWKYEADHGRMFQQLEDNATLKHLTVSRVYFGSGYGSDAVFADKFFFSLERGVFENVSLSSVTVLPQMLHTSKAVELSTRLDGYLKENDQACMTRGCLFMFCLCEAPDDSPLAILRGFPFESEDFRLVSYVKEARGWVPRKAHRTAPDSGKRKEAPGEAEGQSAAKRPK